MSLVNATMLLFIRLYQVHCEMPHQPWKKLKPNSAVH
jgi:hypothetical protein